MSTLHGYPLVRFPSDLPDAHDAPADLPLALGLELTPELMLAAYRRGIFPWSVMPVTWWSPNPRSVIELNGLHVSRRLGRTIRQGRFRVTLDHAFREVVLGCAAPADHRGETWISPEFVDCFTALHRAGYAHSVECWQDGELAGGVFGVGINGFFSAESMFHRATDASKIAVYWLVRQLNACGVTLLDIQVISPHTATLGAIEIPRDEYLARLERALAVRVSPLERAELAPPNSRRP